MTVIRHSKTMALRAVGNAKAGQYRERLQLQFAADQALRRRWLMRLRKLFWARDAPRRRV